MAIEVEYNKEQLKRNIADFASYKKPVYIHSKEIKTHITLEEAQKICDFIIDIKKAAAEHREENPSEELGGLDQPEDKAYLYFDHTPNIAMNKIQAVIKDGGGILRQEFVDRLYDMDHLPEIRNLLSQLKEQSQRN